MLAGRTLKEVIVKVPDDQLPLVLALTCCQSFFLFLAREVRLPVLFISICYEQLMLQIDMRD